MTEPMIVADILGRYPYPFLEIDNTAIVVQPDSPCVVAGAGTSPSHRLHVAPSASIGGHNDVKSCTCLVYIIEWPVFRVLGSRERIAAAHNQGAVCRSPEVSVQTNRTAFVH